VPAAPAEQGTPPSAASEPDGRERIVILGDSLTAGHGLLPEQAYPTLLQARIDAAGLDFEVINAGVTGDTTAAGLRRIDWVLREPAAVLVLALGGNDGLRGIDPPHAKENLRAMVERAREKDPDTRIILAGMQSPPNMGARYTKEFEEIYPALAEELDLALVPFLLESVGGVPELNLPDGIHPNEEGQELVARNVWEILEPVLRGEEG
jgi:acyl-CoA thioesterase-1